MERICPTATTYDVDDKNGSLSVPVTLSADNGWTGTVHVSPGLYLSDDGAGEGGEEILEQGHDFRAEEPDIDHHFELSSETIHLMSKNNVIIWRGSSVDGTLRAVNRLRGGINVVKEVVDAQGRPMPLELTQDEEFTVQAHLQQGGKAIKFDDYDGDDNEFSKEERDAYPIWYTVFEGRYPNMALLVRRRIQ